MNAQVAVIDAYKGSQKSTVKIGDSTDKKKARSEDLRYDSVVAVNPGEYMVTLSSTDGSLVSKQDLVALNRESYIIMRVGIEAQQGQQYPQELMVYPKSDPSALHSSAPAVGVSAALLALLPVFLQ